MYSQVWAVFKNFEINCVIFVTSCNDWALILKVAIYRPGYGQFRVEDVDPNLCTHGFYGFADLHNDTWTLKIWDPWLDQAPEDCEPGYCNFDNYRKFIALKEQNPDFVPMISIGRGIYS